MVLVSNRTYYRNQRHYLNLAKRGEDVVLSTRMGRFRLTPVHEETKRQERELTEADLEKFCEEGENPPIEVDAETWAEIEKAHEEWRRGEFLRFDSFEELDKYLETL